MQLQPMPDTVWLAGWPSARVDERHLRLARPLVEQGLGFCPLDRGHTAAVEALIQQQIGPDLAVKDDAGGVVALDPSGRLIGAVIGIGAKFANTTNAFMIAFVAVDPSWQSNGVGSVLIGAVPQALQTAGHTGRWIFTGNCHQARAKFFQHCGFTVLFPHAPLPLGPGIAAPPESQHPCYFYREVTL